MDSLTPKFTKRDLSFSIFTGLITGILVWRIFLFLNVPEFRDITWSWLIIIIPILWIVGVNLGYFLGRLFSFFNQFGKFAAIGFTNAAIDFGVLNLLIHSTGTTEGFWYGVFKAVSFLAAVIPSYFWNKYWAFWSPGIMPASLKEFLKFLGVAVSAILVNSISATVIATFIDPALGFTPTAWANVAAAAGSALALIFSFAGFKVAVFKR
ncbi:MAG TPA: GtrA family protein [Candidatus Paceibacterota bacterium]